MTHLHSTRRVLNSGRGNPRTQTIKTLGGRGPHWGSLHRCPVPVAGPPQSLTPCSQHFGLPALALRAEATEGSAVTVEPGPLRALLRRCMHTRNIGLQLQQSIDLRH